MRPNIVLTIAAMLCVGIASGIIVAGCGGRSAQTQVDYAGLLRSGDFAAAREAAVASGLATPEERAIAGLATFAESPGTESARAAISLLQDGIGRVESLAAATILLDQLDLLSTSTSPDLMLGLVEVALGSADLGPYARNEIASRSPDTASRDLAVAVLDRVQMTIATPDWPFDTGRLLAIWNACYTLEGGSMGPYPDTMAWRLFQSIGSLAVFISKAAPKSEFAAALINETIRVIEVNSSIAVAARCDLSSPYDHLKMTLKYDRAAAGRLEAALASASGCSRGTYAPTE